MAYRYLPSHLPLIGLGWRDVRNMDRRDGCRRRHEGNDLYLESRANQDHETYRYYSPGLEDGSPRPLLLGGRLYADLQNTSLIPRPSERRESSSNVPFGQAMRRLFKQLEKAEDFYRTFQSEFNNDVAAIKKYATPEILMELWLLKVQGGPRRQPSYQSQEPTDENDPSIQVKVQRFDDINSKLLHCLRVGLDARISDAIQGSSQNVTRLDSIRRLQEKVQLASEYITDLVHKASKSGEDCDALLRELELLKGLVDPSDERNKGLYRSDEEEGDLDEKQWDAAQ